MKAGSFSVLLKTAEEEEQEEEEVTASLAAAKEISVDVDVVTLLPELNCICTLKDKLKAVLRNQEPGKICLPPLLPLSESRALHRLLATSSYQQ